MNKHEGREVLFPDVLKSMMEYYSCGVLDCYFALEEKILKKMEKK